MLYSDFVLFITAGDAGLIGKFWCVWRTHPGSRGVVISTTNPGDNGHVLFEFCFTVTGGDSNTIGKIWKI